MKKSIFLFFAAILCAMTANAYNQAAVDLYFDNSTSQWANCYVSVGHTSWTAFYDMERVSGTQYLWKLPANFNGGNSWGGASGWVVSVDKWDGYPKNENITVKYVWHGDKNVTKLQTSAWVATKIYKANGTESVSKDGTTKTVYKVTSYTKSNYTVTINTVEGGTLTVKDYDNNAVATGASKIHLTVLKFSAAPASGYVLEGVQISDGSTTTTISASEINTKTHTLTSNVTITPVWKATTSTVTVTATATNGTVTGGGVVEEGTSVTLTATPADGYKFVNWTVGGAEVSTANPYTFTAEEDVTVVANFEETPKATIYFVNNSGWSKVQAYAWDGSKGANPGWPGADITANKLGEQIGGFDVYSYTVEQGSYGKVIFNNGSAQTADYVWTDGNYYWHNEAATFPGGTKAQAEEKFSVPVEYDYVYFINTNSWAAVKIYTWTPEVATWPGEAMTKETEQIAGFDVYSYKVVKGTTFGGIKFSDNGGTQTGDLTWKAGKYYAPSKNDWYDDAAAAEAGLAAPVVNTYTVVGSSAPLFGEAWAAAETENDMTLVEGTKYELVKTDVSLTGGEIQYKVAVNHAWDEAYPAENASLNISEAGKYTVTFTFDSNTKEVGATAELIEAAVVLPTVGVKGAWDGWAATTTLTGDNTSASATVNIATAGIYEFGLDVDGSFQASGATIDKANNSTVVTNNAGNMKLTANVLGEYTFTWTYETNTLTVTYPAGEEVEIAKKYYIAGTQNLTGFDWKENGLEIAKEGDVYKHTFTALPTGEYEFKITDGQWNTNEDKTHEWGYSNLGAAYEEVSEGTDGEGNPNGNIKFGIEETKPIIVIFDATAGKITFEGLTEKAPVEDYYTIVGATAITGVDWDPANEDNKMTKDGEVYTLTKTGLQLEAGDYEYKVAKNGAWGNSDYPAEGNQTVTIAENGVYTIVYTYTVSTSLTAVPEKTGEYTPDKPVYTVAGDAALCGTNWDAGDTDNDMTDNGDGTFTWTKTGVKLTGDAGFKVVKNHAFGTAYPAANWVINIANYEGAAIYTVTITFTESSKEIAVTLTKTGNAAPAVISYVLMGVNGDWDNGIALTQNPDNADEYVLENQVIIKATDAVKVVTLTDGTATAWCGNVDTWSNATYTADGDGNIVLEDGIYTFYFKKNDNLIYINQTGYARNVTNTWGTICLPYASSSFTGATFYEVSSLNPAEGLWLDQLAAGTQLVAGKPYIFQATATEITVTYTGEAATTPQAGANGLTGTFTDIAAGGVLVNNYIIANNAVWVANANNTLPANRAYINAAQVPAKQQAEIPGRRRVCMGENAATGVDNIVAPAGQAVKAIENGQLIIIRDGIKYNVQGQVIR